MPGNPTNNHGPTAATATDDAETSPFERARATMICVGGAPELGPVHAANCQMASDWVSWLAVSRNRAQNTIKAYSLTAASWVTWLGERPMGSVGAPEIEAWLARPTRHGKVRAPASVRRDLTVLQTWYRWLEGRGYVHDNPARLVHPPKVRNVHPKPIPDDEWVAAWAAAQDDPGMLVMLGCMFHLGLRSTEAATVQDRHVDRSRQQLVGFTRKGGGDDALPYGEVCQVWADFLGHLWDPAFLVHLEAERKRHLFLHGRRTADGALRDLRRLRYQLGDTWTPHMLRHGFVTNMLRVRMPLEMVSELANHSSLDVTLRYAKRGGGRVQEWRAAEKIRRDGGHVTRSGDRVTVGSVE